MKRLDLIISAIEDALKDFATDSYDYDYHGCCGADLDVGHTADCKLAQALAAARELRDMKPVLWKATGDAWFYEQPLFPATPLYALYGEQA